LGYRLPFHQFVALKHLRGRKSGFLTAIGFLAILGVSFSSCTLTTVLSVQGGFSNDLKQKIISTNAHVIVDKFGSDFDVASETNTLSWSEVVRAVEKLDGVEAVTPIVSGGAMMNARTNNHGIQLKGVDPKTLRKVSKVFDNLDKGDVDYLSNPRNLFKHVRERRRRLYGSHEDKKNADAGVAEIKSNEFIPAPVSPRQRVLPTVIVGREMAKSLRLYIGEEVNIISPLGDIGPTGPIPRSRPFRVGGIFFTGMYEFDSVYAYTSLEAAQKFFNKGKGISEIHVAVEDPEKAAQISGVISEKLGENFRVRPWQEMNASLFSALKLEKIVMFIFLSFAILVASFCIIATLTMLVLEKGAEISVLMTLGTTSQAVQKIFRYEGLLIGIVGTACGLLVGFGLCMTLKYIGLPIDPEVWYIDKLPVNIRPIEFFFVGLASLAITQLATLYPTYVASGMTPVEGLKND